MDNQNYKAEKELTLRDVLLGIGSFARELWRRKWWLLLAGALLGSWLAWRAWSSPVTYTAELTFMINEDESGGNALGGVLGNLGIGNGASEYNLEKVVELSRSRLIVQAVLLDSVVIDGRSDIMANHVLKIYDLPAKWQRKGLDKWANVEFDTVSREQLERTESKILMYLHQLVINGKDDHSALARLNTDETTTIFSYKIKTLNEDLSYHLANNLYARLSEFYIVKTTGNPQATYNNLKSKADSIRQILGAKEYALAGRQDATLGMDLNRDRVTTNRLQRDVQILSGMYAEVLRNLATAEFALNSSTPFFAMIDEPVYPLNKNKSVWFKQALIGVFTGLFFAAILIVIAKIVRDALSSQAG